ncbi:hypothetical protein BABINDRAFT_162537 [Babjeviella inositovora NRRL Y-12698]|uniref:NmrA-like domain-containing protein n=1 Tax=Babjeviella inositovora NRRL Y-12698 TaxID=984486 RepID=A0A1E3QMF5_9ASCO|nr:uncharacterized protein BABINDRAFT_162537 [Babjeviella inositovora NRRL Y-12698]ODQ78865.1 hypothetical protein BABINDRAFT_162537 [Babjeviella inositovora NRRL Y-12698]
MSYKPTVAVLGSNGVLGKPVIEALSSEPFSSKFQLPIRVITRSKGDRHDSEEVKYYTASLDDTASFKDAPHGADVLISLVGNGADPADILDVLATAPSLKVYLPSQFGTDLENTQYLPVLAGKTNHTKQARTQNPNVMVVDVITSLFAQEDLFVYERPQISGANLENKTATFRGDPAFKFNVSKFPDIGKSVAVIASTPVEKLKDTIRIYSDSVSQEEVVSQWEKAHGTKLERSSISAEETLKEAKDKLTGGFKGSDFVFYLQTFISQGEGRGLAYHNIHDREFVNPGESLWKWETF